MKKLEDIMNHYSLDDSSSVIPDASLSAKEKEQILAKTLEKAGLDRVQEHSGSGMAADRGADSYRCATGSVKTGSRSAKRRPFMLGIACVLVLAMATVSFAAMALDKNFFDFFSAKEPAQMEMLESMGTLIDKQVSDSGLTVHVKSAVGDSNAVNVLFDVVAPKGTVLDAESYSFSNAFVDLPGSTLMGAGYYFELLPDDNPKDNKITMMLCYTTDTNLSGNTMRFRFSDLTTPKTAEELDAMEKLPSRSEPGTTGDAYDYNNLIAKGDWTIDFPLNYKDASTTINPGQSIKLFGGDCKVTHLRYSPISATLTIEGSAIKEFDSSPDMQGTDSGSLAPDGELVITLKDGSTVATSGTGTGINSESVFTVSAQFSQIVDPANIASITYAGTTIEIK